MIFGSFILFTGVYLCDGTYNNTCIELPFGNGLLSCSYPESLLKKKSVQNKSEKVGNYMKFIPHGGRSPLYISLLYVAY